jgi:hypothetical protein
LDSEQLIGNIDDKGFYWQSSGGSNKTAFHFYLPVGRGSHDYDLLSLWQEPDLKPVLPEKFYIDMENGSLVDYSARGAINQLRDFIAYQQKQLEGLLK